MKLEMKKQADIILAVAVAGIVAAMIVPLPTWLLETLLAVNLAAEATFWWPRSTPRTRSRWRASPRCC